MHSEGRTACYKHLAQFGGDDDDGCFEILGSKHGDMEYASAGELVPGPYNDSSLVYCFGSTDFHGLFF